MREGWIKVITIDTEKNFVVVNGKPVNNEETEFWKKKMQEESEIQRRIYGKER